KFVLDVIEKLESEHLIDPVQIYMHGFSQACALNFRFALTYPEILKGVVAISGGIPGDLDTNPIYKPFAANTLYLYGDTDEFYPREKFAEFDSKLAERLPNYRSRQFNAKHEITDEMRDEVRQFFADQV